ncbi:MAG: HAD family hydrolase [Planctomycetes bacterium]|nr:HAD family hydrolase [Planctomycetota bacterium]
MMKRPAVFLDRDGTIIDDRSYIGDPAQVKLLPGSADAIRRFSESGYAVVVVSNQSGIARGFFSEEDLSAVHARVEELLKAQGATLDGAYYCPYLDGPEAVVEAYRQASELRKPEPGMLFQAARDMDIDLSRSWMIGDSASDVAAGRAAGCRTILLDSTGEVGETVADRAEHVVASLAEAAEIVKPVTGNPGEVKAADSSKDAADGQVVSMLSKIHGQLERSTRQQRQHDFSLIRLFGALLQMIAIVVGLWGVASLMSDQHAAATARFALACFLQLASATTFAIDRFR